MEPVFFGCQSVEKGAEPDRIILVDVVSNQSEVTVEDPADDKYAAARPAKRFIERTKIRLAVNDESRTIGGHQLIAIA